MNKIKPFGQFIKESTAKSIGDRFEQLVDGSDSLGQELKFDDKVELNTICGTLEREYPNIFKVECDYMLFHGAEHFTVFMKSFNTEQDYEGGDPTDYKEVKVRIPSSVDDW